LEAAKRTSSRVERTALSLTKKEEDPARFWAGAAETLLLLPSNSAATGSEFAVSGPNTAKNFGSISAVEVEHLSIGQKY
jgi:hypothetical protein